MYVDEKFQPSNGAMVVGACDRVTSNGNADVQPVDNTGQGLCRGAWYTSVKLQHALHSDLHIGLPPSKPVESPTWYPRSKVHSSRVGGTNFRATFCGLEVHPTQFTMTPPWGALRPASFKSTRCIQPFVIYLSSSTYCGPPVLLSQALNFTVVGSS